jgi:hypothetical protein
MFYCFKLLCQLFSKFSLMTHKTEYAQFRDPNDTMILQQQKVFISVCDPPVKKHFFYTIHAAKVVLNEIKRS